MAKLGKDRNPYRAGFLRRFPGLAASPLEQIEALGFEQRHRLGAATHSGDFIADALQRPLQILAHGSVIFGQKDSCHGVSML